MDFTPYTPADDEQPILELSGIKFYDLGIVLPDDCSLDNFAAAYLALTPFFKWSSFWIGDMILAGHDTFHLTEWSDGHLDNVASVCRRVPPARRRRDDNLYFGHHTEIARLEPAMQTHFLNLASLNSWSVRELRRQIVLWENDGKPPVHTFVCRGAAARVKAIDVNTGDITLTLTDADLMDLEPLVHGATITVTISIDPPII